jgi:outer membrane protein TolC
VSDIRRRPMTEPREWLPASLRPPSFPVAGALAVLVLAGPLEARQPAARDTVRLGMADAVAIALERNPALRLGRLEVEQAEADVREARGGLLPQVGSSAGYTREVLPVDPFAGTRAGALLGGQGPTDWLTYNERARTDGDPGTQPIPLPEFQARQDRAYLEAGVSPGEAGGSPFSVPNQAQAGLSVSQPVFAPGAAAQVRGSRVLRDASLAGLRRQRAETADSVRRAYLAALLASEQADVRRRGVERAEDAVVEAARRVEAGAASVSERLAAQVEATNLRAELIQAGLQEERARNGLKLALGLAPALAVVLTDRLVPEDDFALAAVPLEAALGRALERRGDIEEARLAAAAQRAFVEVARAQRRPTVSAVLDLSLLGNVPDDRTQVVTDPLRPFRVDTERRGPFTGDFWDLGASAGVQLQWNVFQGGRLRAQEERARVAVRQAEVRLGQIRDLARVDVEDALLEMRAARERALIQRENVALAERSYEVARTRVLQGVATPMERREASEQLDRSRMGLLQAVHDYRAARSRFLAAVGLGPGEEW